MDLLPPYLVLTFVFGACVWVKARRYALFQALLVGGLLLWKIPFLRLLNGSDLNLAMLLIGLFGPLSLLTLLLTLWACLAKQLHLDPLPPSSARFLALFGLLVFLNTLGILPLDFIYTSPLTLGFWALLAFYVHKILGVLFVLILVFNFIHPSALPYNLYMDAYLWLVVLWYSRPKI
ncbi:hypothetical protein [Helicobacter felis]|uniref:hypothetical protein n=1 Tax=Helicobacter felis TaxID=214 RepID=UPI000CF1B475|nr:hypothetical protein [Helicobacter felis]